MRIFTFLAFVRAQLLTFQKGNPLNPNKLLTVHTCLLSCILSWVFEGGKFDIFEVAGFWYVRD